MIRTLALTLALLFGLSLALPDIGAAKGPKSRPGGWSKGKKKGWKGGGTPPGLRKSKGKSKNSERGEAEADGDSIQIGVKGKKGGVQYDIKIGTGGK